MTSSRGRLTVPGIVRLLAGIAFLGALWPVFNTSLQQTSLDTGEVYLLSLVLPLALLVMLAIVFRKAIGGAA